MGGWLGARFWLGAVAGVALAPLAFVAALLMGRRVFHRSGVLCVAEVEPVHPVASALAGPAVVRFSGAGREEGSTAPDVVGVALRFLRDDSALALALEAARFDGDQDLDLASFSGLLPHAVWRSMRTTDVSDYLANSYRSLSPCRVCETWTGELWAVPGSLEDPVSGDSRVARLKNAIATGAARLDLEVRTGSQTIPIATIWLRRLAAERAPSLRTSVLRRGRGLVVGGVRSGLRIPVYAASQAGRALRGG